MMLSNFVQLKCVYFILKKKKNVFTVKGVKFKTHATFELLIIYSQKSIQHTPSQYTPSFIFHPIMINTILGKKEKNKNHL